MRLSFLLIAITLSACVSPFEPELEGHEDLMVVEGLLSNLEGPHYVKLSKSISLLNDSSGFVPVTTANVIIESEKGSEFVLVQNEPGIYSISGTIAEIGQSYRCVISLEDGTAYQSDYQELLPPTEIDSIYFELETIENDPNDLQNVHFFVDSKPANGSPYLRWDYLEDWIYKAPYQPQFKLLPDGNFVEAPMESVCFSQRNGSEITLNSTLNKVGGRVVKEKLTTITNQTTKLRYGYLMRARQYTVTKQTSEFWNKLGESNQNLGTLFDPQPGVLPTNISSVNKGSERPIIGLFEVSSAVEEEIYVDYTSVDGLITKNPKLADCPTLEYFIANYPSRQEFDEAMIKLVNEGNLIFLNWLEEVNPDDPLSTPVLLGYTLITTTCTDCEKYGTGTKTAPNYWPQ